MRQRLTTWICVALLSVCSFQAGAQIITTPDLDNLCKSAPAVTHRVTIVYVDISSLKRGDNEWGNTILSRLELGPRERLTVVGVNPSTFEIREVFDSCYPTHTKLEMAEIAKGRGLWGKLTQLDPESQQRENLETYNARLGNALDNLLSLGDEFRPGKRRNILGAIAVDKNRFSNRSAYYRLIIFTSATVQDDFNGAADEAKVLAEMLKKYPASFSGAEVSVYGVAGTDYVPLELRQRLFSNFFLGSWAHVQSFSQSLPRQKAEIYAPVTRLSGTFEGGGTKGSLELVFSEMGATPEDNWLAFTVGSTSLHVPFQPEYTCTQSGCTLTGTVSENVPPLTAAPFFRKGDVLSLKGQKGGALQGELRSGSKEVFTGGKDEAKYTFSLQR